MSRQIRIITGCALALVLMATLPLLACGSDAPAATAVTPLAQTSSETDREMLAALYNATDGENWDRNANWMSDTPIGGWHGVATDGNGRVTELNLEGNQLSGEIPPGLGNLANLEVLSVWSNRLSGQIPPELGNLSRLNTLYLWDNRLGGDIPPELGNLANLRKLSLSKNKLGGCIPSSLEDQLEEKRELEGLSFC